MHSSPRASTSSSTTPSWLSLQSDIDRLLSTFDTKIDVSCFEDLEDQLLVCPRETFADLCYSDAVDTSPINDSDWCVFVNTPRRVNWDHKDIAASEPENDEFGFLVRHLRLLSSGSCALMSSQDRPLCIDPHAKPDSSAIDSFTSSSSCTSESDDLEYPFPFFYGDSPSAMAMPDPYTSIHYSPSPIGQVKQPTRWNRTITRLTSFARQRF